MNMKILSKDNHTETVLCTNGMRIIIFELFLILKIRNEELKKITFMKIAGNIWAKLNSVVLYTNTCTH